MARGGSGRRKKKQAESEDSTTKFAVGRGHAALLGVVCGACAGGVLAIEWIEDFDLMLPLAGGGAVVGGVLAALVGDKVWETISDWI